MLTNVLYFYLSYVVRANNCEYKSVNYAISIIEIQLQLFILIISYLRISLILVANCIKNSFHGPLTDYFHIFLIIELFLI